MRSYVADVIAGTGLIDRTLFYDPRGKDASRKGLAFIRALRAERFDTVLLLPNSLRTGWLGWLSVRPAKGWDSPATCADGC